MSADGYSHAQGIGPLVIGADSLKRPEPNPYKPPSAALGRREAVLWPDDRSGFERLVDSLRFFAISGSAGAATTLLTMRVIISRGGCGTDALGTAISLGGIVALLVRIIAGWFLGRPRPVHPDEFPKRAEP